MVGLLGRGDDDGYALFFCFGTRENWREYWRNPSCSIDLLKVPEGCLSLPFMHLQSENWTYRVRRE